MPVDPRLRSLTIDLPTRPDAVLRLSTLLARDEVGLHEVGELVERDMALASAVLKAVNSSLYGLAGRVQTVRQAVTYLGTREVAAVTYEMGLRAVFPAAPELEPLWQRAAERGLLMGRIGDALGIDPWTSHSAGLFEECGKAVLFRHAPVRYLPMLVGAQDDAELLYLEHREYGVSHDALGAALCESWGLAAPAVQSVRHHVTVHDRLQIPQQVLRPSICVLSALAHTMMSDPARLDEVAALMAPQAQLDPTLVLRGARRVHEQLQADRRRAPA